MKNKSAEIMDKKRWERGEIEIEIGIGIGMLYAYPFKSLHAIIQHSRNLVFRTQPIINTHEHTRNTLCNISTPYIFRIEASNTISTSVKIYS